MTQIDNRPDRFSPVENLLQNRTRLMSDSASLPKNYALKNLKIRFF
jgi:hypothetical protein